MTEVARSVAIKLRSCSKTFPDGTKALQPLDLDVGAGETLVILGPSGCGKTTTLRIIAGLDEPDPGGKVLFDGEDVTPVPIERRDVGIVFQSYALFPNMSVRENVAYGLRVRRRPAAEQRSRADEMLAMMRIEALADRRIDQLSGGQRQRVALARALAIRPRALLLDEPLTALDAKLRETLRVEIDGLLRRVGITAIYVTHDQAEAMALGDRIVVMEHGRVAQIGSPREIYRAPKSRFVADFIGTMNKLPGRAEAGRFVTAAGSIPWSREAGAAEAAFRPEDARIVPAGPDALRATVTTSFFLGDRTRLVLDVAGTAVTVDSSERAAWTRGEAVHLAVPPQALIDLGDRA
ncbi:MAG: ABC transporter ATP-binding protein [Alphaproteobacteria bacterium]|nr:ABC transporter ATP-binding protein [Alphaproteobacteria bacterium]